MTGQQGVEHGDWPCLRATSGPTLDPSTLLVIKIHIYCISKFSFFVICSSRLLNFILLLSTLNIYISRQNLKIMDPDNLTEEIITLSEEMEQELRSGPSQQEKGTAGLKRNV